MFWFLNMLSLMKLCSAGLPGEGVPGGEGVLWGAGLCAAVQTLRASMAVLSDLGEV